MIGEDERIVWGEADGDKLFGVITRKKVGNGGTIVQGLDNRGSCRCLAARDRHKSVSITATVGDGVTEDNIPLVGDPFRATVNGRVLTFYCEHSELESFPEDASVLTITGRTLGETPVGQPFNKKGN